MLMLHFDSTPYSGAGRSAGTSPLRPPSAFLGDIGFSNPSLLESSRGVPEPMLGTSYGMAGALGRKAFSADTGLTKSCSVDDVTRVESERLRPKRLPHARRSNTSASLTDDPRPRLLLHLPQGNARIPSAVSSPELDRCDSFFSPVLPRAPASGSCRCGPGRSSSLRRFPSFDAVEVVPGLFLSAHHCAADVEALRAFNVSLVVNVAVECDIGADLRRNTQGVRYIRFLLRDHSDEAIARTFLPVTKIIHNQLHRRKAGQAQQLGSGSSATPEPESRRGGCGGVLVHCRMGVSRSATLVLAYLMLYGSTIADIPPEGEWASSLWSSQTLREERASVEQLGGEAFGLPYEEAGNEVPTGPQWTSPPPPSTFLEDETSRSGDAAALQITKLCCVCAAALAQPELFISRSSVGVRPPTPDPPRRLGLRMEAALQAVHRVKPDINPNIGFVMALNNLSAQLGDHLHPAECTDSASANASSSTQHCLENSF